MKKTTAGLIAGAAGILLLAGGSTYALWSNTDTVAGGTINTGNLDVAVGSAAAWNDISVPATPVVIPAIASFSAVPGDTLQFTQPVTITATGNNVKASLAVKSAANTGAVFAAGSGVTATYKLMDGATAVTPTSGTGAFGTTDNVYNFPAAVTKTYTVQVTVVFDRATSAQTTTNATGALNGLTFQLDQVRAP